MPALAARPRLLRMPPSCSCGRTGAELQSAAAVNSQWHGSLKCPEDDQPAVLGQLDGKDLNLKWATYTPLDVPAGSSLTLLLCNIENRQRSPPVFPSKDTLVRSVGARAHVYVLVANSFNVHAKGDVFVGPQNMSRHDVEYISNATRDQRATLERRRQYWEWLDGKCAPSRRRRRRWGGRSRGVLLQKPVKEEGGVEEPEEDEVEGEMNQTFEEYEKEKEKKKKAEEEGKHKQKGARRPALTFTQVGNAQVAHASPYHVQVPVAVAGPVGKGAIIQVTVKDSGNVVGQNVALHQAVLVGPALLHKDGLDRSIVQVGVFNSGNVIAKGGSVSMAMSYLLYPAVMARRKMTSADINVHLEASGKVEAEHLTMAGVDHYGALVSALVKTLAKVKDSKISVTLVETANFDGEELNFVDFPSNDQPRFLDPLIAFRDVQATGTNIDVLLSSSGNVRLAGGDVLGSGYLLDPVVGGGEFRSSSMRLTVLNSLNLEADSWFMITPHFHGPFVNLWADELVDLQGATHLDFKAVLGNSANFKVQQLEVDGGNQGGSRTVIGEVIYLADDVEPSHKNNLEVTVDDSVNWEGKLLIAEEAQFSLMENAIDINTNFVDSHVSLSISRSGNAHGGVVCLADELLDEPIEGDHFNTSTIVAVVSDAASVIANRFEMKLEDLVDEIVDVNDLFDTQVTVKVTSVGNVRADDVVLHDSAELVETFADGDNLLAGTTMVLGITNCGNVKAKQLTMRDDSYLLQDVMEGTFITPVPVTITVASSGNFQGPGSAEISRDSILIRHVIDPQDDTSNPTPPTKLTEFGQTSITLTESASLQNTQKATLSYESYLLGPVVDEVPGSRKDFTDLSLLKSLSMFATAVGSGDGIKFESQSAPCEQGDLPKFALPFAYSCVPLP